MRGAVTSRGSEPVEGRPYRSRKLQEASMKAMSAAPFLFLFLAVAVVAACTDGDDDGGPVPFCGDRVCNGGETTTTCAADCPSVPVCGDRVCSGTETAAACPADCARCGDGVCNGTETTSSCPGDCPPGACSTTDVTTCAGETICLNGTCVAAFGRTYTIVAYSATVPQFKPDGTTWDAVGGAPDPYAIVTLNGQALWMTTAIQDNFTPTWNQGAPSVIAAGSTFIIDVNDEDVAADDGVFRCMWSPLTADDLHIGGISCSGALGSAVVGFVTQ